MADLTVKVPDVGEGIAEVELVSWAVSEGQSVQRNEIIAEVMTDKATVEVPAPSDGVIASLTGEVGEILLVGSPLFSLQVDGNVAPVTEVAPGTGVAPGTDVAPAAAVAPSTVAPAAAVAPAAPAPGSPTSAPVSSPPRQLAVVQAADIPADAVNRGAANETARNDISSNGTAPPRPEGRKPTASPAVRRRARDAGIDLRTVTGSGPAGRIEHEDLDLLFATATSGRSAGVTARSSGPGGRQRPNTAVQDEPIVGIRRKIAEQMVASTSSIPHITYVEEIDMTALEDLRATLNEQRTDEQPKLTLLPFLIRALVNEVANFPAMNAHVLDPSPPAPGTEPSRPEPATLRSFAGVHVGIATQTDGGLVVPVLRHAEAETLWSTAARIIELSEAARSGSAPAADLSGSTITITSLGALGGLVTTPVINKPETTIVGVNKMVTKPVWDGDTFVPRKMMNLSSSFDHRVIDGWDAANFIQAIKRSLEQPALLFMDSF